jgi:hypothetical protein
MAVYDWCTINEQYQLILRIVRFLFSATCVQSMRDTGTIPTRASR